MTILMMLATKLNCQVKHVMKSIFRGHLWSNKTSSQTHPRRIILKALTKAAYSQCCSSVLYSRKNSKNFVRKKIICIVPNNFSVTFLINIQASMDGSPLEFHGPEILILYVPL